MICGRARAGFAASSNLDCSFWLPLSTSPCAYRCVRSYFVAVELVSSSFFEGAGSHPEMTDFSCAASGAYLTSVHLTELFPVMAHRAEALVCLPHAQCNRASRSLPGFVRWCVPKAALLVYAGYNLGVDLHR
jgi:hypothetical protein